MSAHKILKELFLEHNHADILDPGNAGSIIVDRQLGYVSLVSVAAETRTLAVPERAGIFVLLYMKTDGGNITVTATGGFDDAGNTALVFTDEGQFALLVSVGADATYRWRLAGYEGTAAPNQQAALTTQLTLITHTAPGTPDYALQNLVQNTGFGFATADEGNTTLSVVKNLQTRLAEVEAVLEAHGLVAAN